MIGNRKSHRRNRDDPLERLTEDASRCENEASGRKRRHSHPFLVSLRDS